MSKPQAPTTYRADKLDVRQFARDQAVLHGQNSLNEFERLREEAFALGETALRSLHVTWQAEGIWKTLPGGAAETRLHLQARIEIPLQCQKCLEPVQEVLEVDRSFLFVTDEATAMKLDDESEEDVLVASKAFDLLELIEDELLMALPLVPRHTVCPVVLPVSDADDFAVIKQAAEEDGTQAKSPFAALKGLKSVK